MVNDSTDDGLALEGLCCACCGAIFEDVMLGKNAPGRPRRCRICRERAVPIPKFTSDGRKRKGFANDR